MASDARSEDSEFDQMLNTVDAWIETRGEMQREIDRLKAELAEARRIIPLDDDTECDIRREERRRIVAEVDVWAGPGAWLFCLKRNLLAAIEEADGALLESARLTVSVQSKLDKAVNELTEARAASDGDWHTARALMEDAVQAERQAIAEKVEGLDLEVIGAQVHAAYCAEHKRLDRVMTRTVLKAVKALLETTP